MNTYQLFPKDGVSWLERIKVFKTKFSGERSPATQPPHDATMPPPPTHWIPGRSSLPSNQNLAGDPPHEVECRNQETTAVQFSFFQGNSREGSGQGTQTTSFNQQYYNPVVQQTMQFNLQPNLDQQNNGVQYTNSYYHSTQNIPSHNPELQSTPIPLSSVAVGQGAVCTDTHTSLLSQYVTPAYSPIWLGYQDTNGPHGSPDTEVFFSESDEGWSEMVTVNYVQESRPSTPGSEDSFCSELRDLVTDSPDSECSEPEPECDLCYAELEPSQLLNLSGERQTPNIRSWPYKTTNFQDPLSWNAKLTASQYDLNVFQSYEGYVSEPLISGWPGPLPPVEQEPSDSGSDNGIWFSAGVREYVQYSTNV